MCKFLEGGGKGQSQGELNLELPGREGAPVQEPRVWRGWEG
jgi:hypothetical protein